MNFSSKALSNWILFLFLIPIFSHQLTAAHFWYEQDGRFQCHDYSLLGGHKISSLSKCYKKISVDQMGELYYFILKTKKGALTFSPTISALHLEDMDNQHFRLKLDSEKKVKFKMIPWPSSQASLNSQVLSPTQSNAPLSPLMHILLRTDQERFALAIEYALQDYKSILEKILTKLPPFSPLELRIEKVIFNQIKVKDITALDDRGQFTQILLHLPIKYLIVDGRIHLGPLLLFPFRSIIAPNKNKKESSNPYIELRLRFGEQNHRLVELEDQTSIHFSYDAYSFTTKDSQLPLDYSQYKQNQSESELLPEWSFFSYEQFAEIINNNSYINWAKESFHPLLESGFNQFLKYYLPTFANELIQEFAQGKRTIPLDGSAFSLNSLMVSYRSQNYLDNYVQKVQKLQQTLDYYFQSSLIVSSEQLWEIEKLVGDLYQNRKNIKMLFQFTQTSFTYQKLNELILTLQNIIKDLENYPKNPQIYLQQKKEIWTQSIGKLDPFADNRTKLQLIHRHLQVMEEMSHQLTPNSIPQKTKDKFLLWNNLLQKVTQKMSELKELIVQPIITEQKWEESVKVIISPLYSQNLHLLKIDVLEGKENAYELPQLPLREEDQTLLQNRYDGLIFLNVLEFNKKIAEFHRKKMLDICFLYNNHKDEEDNYFIVNCSDKQATGTHFPKIQITFKEAPQLVWDHHKNCFVLLMTHIDVQSLKFFNRAIALKAYFQIERPENEEGYLIGLKIKAARGERTHKHLFKIHNVLSHQFSKLFNHIVSSAISLFEEKNDSHHLSSPTINTQSLILGKIIHQPDFLKVPFSFRSQQN